MDFDYRLPGTDAPRITIRRSPIGGIAVFVDGVRLRGRRSVYEVPGADGETHPMKVAGSWTGLRAIADGWDTPLEPPVPAWSMVLALLPLVLVAGGLVGGILGALGLAINSVIGRSALRAPLRAVLMLLVLTGVAAAGAGIAITLTSVANPRGTYTLGTCLNGVAPGADLVASAPTAVDCGTAHDGEVIGTFRLDVAASFPAESGLSDAARAQCPGLFATYVGLAFGSSRLDILPVVPTQSSWLTGDREVACVAIATDGSKLTGSVKGSRQ